MPDFELAADQRFCMRDPAVNKLEGKRFRATLHKVWRPILGQHGFVGKGAVFRRLHGSSLHVISTQAWKYGGGICVNLGIHFDFLPRAAWLPQDLESFEEPHCAIRRRLCPAGRGGGFWWRYGADQAESLACALNLVTTLETRGFPFFEQLGRFPGLYPELNEKESRSLFARQEVMLPGPGGCWPLVQDIQAYGQ